MPRLLVEKEMTRPISHGPHMLMHDATALSNILRRTLTGDPTKRDITMISRALKRAITDEKRNNTKEIVPLLTEALSLASTTPFKHVRSLFQNRLRAAIGCLVDERARKKSA